MKQALISPNEQVYSYAGSLLGDRVAEVSAAPFEVSPPLFWVACADDVVADQWYYNPSNAQIVLIPLAPSILASFSPKSVVVNAPTTLSWTVTGATGVMLSSYGSQVFPLLGSMAYTYANPGTYTETVTAIDPNGNFGRPFTVNVVLTAGEVDATANAPFTVI